MVDGDEQFEFRVEFGEDIFDEEVHEIEAEDVDIDIGSIITSPILFCSSEPNPSIKIFISERAISLYIISHPALRVKPGEGDFKSIDAMRPPRLIS